MTTFLKFREAVLAKAFRRSKMLRARKLTQRVAGGQKLLPLMHPSKSQTPATRLRNGGKRHSKDGAAE